MKLTSRILQNFGKANRIFFPVFLCLIVLSAAAYAQTAPSTGFKRLWIDYDITQNGQKGMRIHTEFEVYNMKGIPGYLGLYFQYRDGTPLKDKNQTLYSSAGEVAIYVEINPGYNPTTYYADLDAFMPYTELDLPDGKYELQIQANVIYKQGGIIGSLTNFDFIYSQGNVTTTTKKTADATFTRAWVDYDVREGNRKGMRVHVKFSAMDMKGVSGKLAIFFQKRGGDPLYSNSAFRATGQRVGEMVAYYAITPAYDEADYSDASVFIPYSEFKSVLPRGTHNLQMDIDVIYQNGNLIKHLSTEDFWFEW